MEASALQAPGGVTRLSLGPLLRLRSDEQLVAAFRAGSQEAFDTLHGRYQQRLFAYARQMLGGSRQDAEDVLQDVFVRAYGALRADDREVNVRAWLYRVAHNRCIDQLRRPTPPASEIFEMTRRPLHDPFEQAQRREDLRRLVDDVGRLPEQQRSALLMREMDGLSYADLAVALDTSVAAVKSLLVRARVGLVEAVEARDMDCSIIRLDLTAAYDRGVKASGRARRHMRECEGCREYRAALRGMRRSFAALSPLGAGPLAMAAKLLGLGGAGGGAAAGAGGGAGAAMSTGIGAASACKVAAVVCTAALATGGAVEVKLTVDHATHASAKAAARAAAPVLRTAVVPRPPEYRPTPSRAGEVRLLRSHLPSTAPAKHHGAPHPVARRTPVSGASTRADAPSPDAGLPVADAPAAAAPAGSVGEVVENPAGGAFGPEEDVSAPPVGAQVAEPAATVSQPTAGVPETAAPEAAAPVSPAVAGGREGPAAPPSGGVSTLTP